MKSLPDRVVVDLQEIIVISNSCPLLAVTGISVHGTPCLMNKQ